MDSRDLCFLSANELARRLRARDLSAQEVLEAHLAQIARVNPHVNAVCTLAAAEARAGAKSADQALAAGETPGPLHGLPVVIKDLAETAGIRTTYGSRVYESYVPEVDALIVDRMKRAGAIVVGKTNTPEFGAGAQTFNAVFGETCNPYDLGKTCGGSSGGSAVALATGMAPLASGSDLGGSLRNPAAFCNVVGFRPSIGRVPVWPTVFGWSSLSVQGPMARSVADAALLLSVMAGPDTRVPTGLREPGASFRAPLERDFRGVRIAWSRDLGLYPIDRRVTAACEAQRGVFAELGSELEEGEPDFRGADATFQTLRAWLFAGKHGEDWRRHRKLLKDTLVWNIEKGLALSGEEVAKAEAARTELFARVQGFFESYEFLVLPATSVPPFPIEERYVTEINGQKLETYIDWLGVTYAITLPGLPAVSVPCGFTEDGLPVGLQIVGRYGADFAVLQLAHAFEQATRFGERRPALAKDKEAGDVC